MICAFFCVKDGTGRTKVIDFWMQVGRIGEEPNLKKLRIREDEKKEGEEKEENIHSVYYKEERKAFRQT